MYRIFGPPGTGKTTTLLNMVEEALSNGTSPNTIAFLAFTRKAANEAKERAAVRFNLDPENDLPYFRTLHSLATVRLCACPFLRHASRVHQPREPSQVLAGHHARAPAVIHRCQTCHPYPTSRCSPQTTPPDWAAAAAAAARTATAVDGRRS